MGKKASEFRRITKRTMRATPLTGAEKKFLRENAEYEGISYHKRAAGDFGLTPPAAPRPDKTLCDEANGSSARSPSHSSHELSRVDSSATLTGRLASRSRCGSSTRRDKSSKRCMEAVGPACTMATRFAARIPSSTKLLVHGRS